MFELDICGEVLNCEDGRLSVHAEGHALLYLFLAATLLQHYVQVAFVLLVHAIGHNMFPSLAKCRILPRAASRYARQRLNPLKSGANKSNFSCVSGSQLYPCFMAFSFNFGDEADGDTHDSNGRHAAAPRLQDSNACAQAVKAHDIGNLVGAAAIHFIYRFRSKCCEV